MTAEVVTEDTVARLRRAGCVFAEDEARLLGEAAGKDAATLDILVARRCAGEPLEVVVGFAEFAGLRIAVDSGVFVPRQRTIGLVDIAAERLAELPPVERLAVDLGCGTGALATALLARVDCTVYAVDISERAVACARRNLRHPSATVVRGDLFDPLPPRLRGEVRVVLANLPYVPTDALPMLPREARLHEPLTSLHGGTDGVRPLENALGRAGEWLHPDGIYLAELHEGQIEVAAAVAARPSFDLTAIIDTEDRTALVRLTKSAGA